MKKIYNKLVTENKHKKILYMESDLLNFDNCLPEMIKEFIFKALLRNEKVIMFSDNNKDLSTYFLNENTINKDNLSIISYDKEEFDLDTNYLINLLKSERSNKEILWIIWDFRSMYDNMKDFRFIKKSIENIFSYCNDNVYNLFCSNTFTYEINELKSFLCNFHALIINTENTKIYFNCDEELDKAAFCLESIFRVNEERKKLHSMEEISIGIIHDINNVLTPIIGSVSSLKENIDDRHLLKQLKIIEMCAYDGMNIANKIKKITNNYDKLDIPQVFNIDDLIIDALDLTKNKRLNESDYNGININLITSLKSNQLVRGNATELREVFINIIRNAIDAMPDGGDIEIRTKSKDNTTKIYIADTGIGMSENEMKRAFQPFFTTKGAKGTGLGLSMSYNIIKSHKGYIKISSKLGKGTCFKIQLPNYINTLEKKDKITKKDIEFDGSVLIIDDQYPIRNVIADMVKSIAKCKVKSCGCENIRDELGIRKYDIVMCDFSMPKMNGIEVSNLLKDMQNDCYFCLMTGWVGKIDKERLTKVNFILHKPITKEKILELFLDYNKKKI